MSLHTPYFFIKDSSTVCHNCDGGVSFMSTDSIDERTLHLINLAIEEGKRIKAAEITKALGLSK